MVNIKGLNKALILSSLYNNTLDMNIDNKKYLKFMTVSEANMLLESTSVFGSIYGKPINIDLSQDVFDSSKYNLLYGEGSALKIIDSIRDIKPTNLTELLPKDMYPTKKEYEELGFVFKECRSKTFYKTTLPLGWSLEIIDASDIFTKYNIIDQNKNIVGVVYKKQSYNEEYGSMTLMVKEKEPTELEELKEMKSALNNSQVEFHLSYSFR